MRWRTKLTKRLVKRLGNMWVIYAVFSAVTAALVAIFGKMGLKGVDPVLATTLRGVIMALFLFVVTWGSGAWKNLTWSQITGRDWSLITAAAVAGALSWLFYFLALKDGDATRVAAIDRTSIVLVVLLAAGVLGEQLTVRSVGGAVLVAVGALLIAGK